jgi:hypothetical protein
MRQLAVLVSSLSLLTMSLPACNGAPKGGSTPAAEPSAAGPAPGTLEYDGNTSKLTHVTCIASKVSPSVTLYFTDAPVPPEAATGLGQMELFLNEKRVTQIRLGLAIAENPPRIIDNKIQDYKSKTNPGIESMLVDQPTYVFENAVADDNHVAGRLKAKGAKTDPNQIPHSFDIPFDVLRKDCR